MTVVFFSNSLAGVGFIPLVSGDGNGGGNGVGSVSAELFLNVKG